MAQTKRKRQTKHRGNAAGMVEARGRTGRKPTTEERGRQQTAAERRLSRLDRPPSWKSAANRGGLAAALFGVVLVLLLGQSVAQGVALAGFMLLLYIPMTYYTDLFVYRRRQRKKTA